LDTSFESNDGAASGIAPSTPFGIWGDSGTERGQGTSDHGTGVIGTCLNGTGVRGTSSGGVGVSGMSDSLWAVTGQCNGNTPPADALGTLGGGGVLGVGGIGPGVYGVGDLGPGVYGVGNIDGGGGSGVEGTTGGTNSSGVVGTHTAGGVGVHGSSVSGFGVYGETSSPNDAGVAGVNSAGDGVRGTSSSPLHAGVSANNSSERNSDVPSGFAIWANSNNTGVYVKGTPAGYFAGDVLVTGDLVLVNGGDIAEDFDVEDHDGNCEPGSVLVIGADGKLSASDVPYDTRVAGVVSGAGDLKPGVVLQRFSSTLPRTPVALVGKVFCKVDAAYGKIAAGDLLTTSRTPGHAMKVSDRPQALGAILGKALANLEAGRGLVPILVSLR
jgi:hypothetical protein